MSKIIGFSVLAVSVMTIGIAATSYIGANNYGKMTEATLKAKYQQAQNVRGTYGQKVREAAQVPGMYTEDLQKVTDSAIQGRYGAEGSKAMFQMLKEQNPQIDASMYVKIQQIVESGRNEFQNAQEAVLDVRRSYESQLGLFWRGMWLGLAGFPETDLSKYDPVITEETKQAFDTKRDAAIQLR